MKKLFKQVLKQVNVFGLGLVLFAAVIFIAESGFTSAKKLTQPADGWFSVSVINPMVSHTLPSNLSIDARTDEPAESDDNGCAKDNEGELCTVYLTFTSNATAVPAKISDVNPANESITDDAARP
jgi:hypothetical protein